VTIRRRDIVNHIQRGILLLVHSAITGSSAILPEDFHLEEAEELILQHQIVGLAYEGAVLCGIPKSEPAMNRLFQRYYQLMIHSTAQMRALEKLFSAFEENQIDYLPVKGSNMKNLYPKPAMRTMSDADILIRMEQYERIQPIMLSLGFQPGLESDHELHWEGNNLFFELHKRLIPSYDADYYAVIGDGWQYAEKTDTHRYQMTPENEYLYLFIHYTKHFRNGGIGIRQLLDLWIYRNCHPELNWDIVLDGIRALDVISFYENTQRMLGVWFGDQEEDAKTLFMTDFIFGSGSWGSADSRYTSLALRHRSEPDSSQNVRARIIRDIFFPPKEIMENHFPVLQNQAWLLPFAYPVRWGKVLLTRFHRIHYYKKRYKNADAKKIDSFQQALEYVGLKYAL